MTSHPPIVPVWICAGCSMPWPCPTRRQELRAEYDRAPHSLRLYLTACYLSASQDMTWSPAGPLHSRFLGWLHEGR